MIIGIDLGIKKISLSALDQDENLLLAWTHTSVDQTRDGQLRELGMAAYSCALEVGADSIWIEDVLVGNNRKYSLGLAETKGSVLAALHPLRSLQGAVPHLVDNKQWKKQVIGNGNADKSMIKNHIIETHPAYAPLCEEDQDLYDAAAIGLYGLAILDRAGHLQL